MQMSLRPWTTCAFERYATVAAMVLPVQSGRSVGGSRVQSVDALRGAIMMLMAIDHIRDYVARSAMHFSPTDLDQTTPAIFLTRWITHFCAPVFILTSGVGALLWKAHGNRSNIQLSGFLLSRGLWLILLELTVLRVIMFSNLTYRHESVFLLILWAIGLSMIALSIFVYLPETVPLLIGTAIILSHNLLDSVPASRFGAGAPLWDVLHTQGVFTLSGAEFITAYPVLPWIGVILLGYCLGQVFSWNAQRRQRLLTASGILLTSAFVLVRAIDDYGDPAMDPPNISRTHRPLFSECHKIPAFAGFLAYDVRAGSYLIGTLRACQIGHEQSIDCLWPGTTLLLCCPSFPGASSCDCAQRHTVWMEAIRLDRSPLDGKRKRTISSKLWLFTVGRRRRLGARAHASLSCMPVVLTRKAATERLVAGISLDPRGIRCSSAKDLGLVVLTAFVLRDQSC
jgi:uncharacterized membrane protein